MFKEVLNHMDLGPLWATGLVILLIVFVLIVLYALTRSPAQADRWARIPLSVEEHERRNPRRDEEGTGHE